MADIITFQNRKQRWLLIGGGVLLIILTYLFLTNWRHSIPANSQVVIGLKRTMCFGYCPIYSITIYENGTVVYEGKEYVGVEGVRKANIGTDKVQQLVAEFERVGYFQMKERYDDYMITDNPSAITYIKLGKEEKSVYHYYGDVSTPKELTRLERGIDEVTNSRRWVKCIFNFYPLCGLALSFWVLAAVPLILAIWITWPFVQRGKPLIGVIRGQGVVLLFWALAVIVASSDWRHNKTPVTIVVYSAVGLIEFATVLVVGMFFTWQRRTQVKSDALGGSSL